VGVFPAIKCERQEKDAGGNTVIVRDPRICKQPRPGLSMEPTFPIACDETTHLCVLAGQPPALEP
jgi:hypothetical protein